MVVWENESSVIENITVIYWPRVCVNDDPKCKTGLIESKKLFFKHSLWKNHLFLWAIKCLGSWWIDVPAQVTTVVTQYRLELRVLWWAWNEWFDPCYVSQSVLRRLTIECQEYQTRKQFFHSSFFKNVWKQFNIAKKINHKLK